MIGPAPENTVSNTWMLPLTQPEAIPAQADVVVIGGGIVGVSTAWFLAKQGVDVVLCEKGHIAGEQSGRNWGWVRVQGRDEREIPMMLESMRIWEGLEEAIGEDVGFTREGCFFTANTSKELQSFEEWVGVAESYGIDTRLIDAAELKQHVRRREDGGYTIAHGSVLEHPITPASFRYFSKFLPALLHEWKLVRLSVGREFIDEWKAPKVRELDKPSPFEETRVLNPPPTSAVLRGIRRNLDSVFPQLANTPIIESWAGMLTGTDSGIDIAKFKLGRFFDGSPIRPQSGI